MRIKSSIALFLCLVSVSAPLFSQEAKSRKGSPGLPDSPGATPASPIMAALDTDKDGKLSAAEIAHASKSLLTLDKNGDGVLNNEELRPVMAATANDGTTRPGNAGQASKSFESRDANRDGKISKDELPEQMKERFSQLDQNGDGTIDKTEFEKIASRLGNKGKRPDKDGKDNPGVKPKKNP